MTKSRAAVAADFQTMVQNKVARTEAEKRRDYRSEKTRKPGRPRTKSAEPAKAKGPLGRPPAAELRVPITITLPLAVRELVRRMSNHGALPQGALIESAILLLKDSPKYKGLKTA